MIPTLKGIPVEETSLIICRIQGQKRYDITSSVDVSVKPLVEWTIRSAIKSCCQAQSQGSTLEAVRGASSGKVFDVVKVNSSTNEVGTQFFELQFSSSEPTDNAQSDAQTHSAWSMMQGSAETDGGVDSDDLASLERGGTSASQNSQCVMSSMSLNSGV